MRVRVSPPAHEYKIPNIEFVGYFVFTVLELRASQLLGLRRREYGVARLYRGACDEKSCDRVSPYNMLDFMTMKELDKTIKRKYTISEYNPNWKLKFSSIKDFLMVVFGDKAIQIEHVGSTSIEEMKAKPLIDVLVTVEEVEPFLEQKDEMVEAGYEWGENYIEPNSIIFFKLGFDGEKLENIHVCKKGSMKARQFIVMRDYLRTHPEKVKAYSDLKELNVSLYPDDYPAYREAKAPFLNQLEKEAYEWEKVTQLS